MKRRHHFTLIIATSEKMNYVKPFSNINLLVESDYNSFRK